MGAPGAASRRPFGTEEEEEGMNAATENYPKDKWADRTRVVYMELSDEQEAMFRRKAAQQGLTLEEYIRTRLGFPP
jgi:hypothetical protein